MRTHQETVASSGRGGVPPEETSLRKRQAHKAQKMDKKWLPLMGGGSLTAEEAAYLKALRQKEPW